MRKPRPANWQRRGSKPARAPSPAGCICATQGTEAALTVDLTDAEAVETAFTAAHRARFGFATPGRALVVEAVAVEAVAAGERVVEAVIARREQGAPEPIDNVAMWSGGAGHSAPVFERTALLAGDRIAGPALIREANATTVVEPGWAAEVTSRDHMLLRRACCRATSGSPAAPRTPIRCCWSCSTTCS